MLRPLGNKIIVKETGEAQEKTASGIIIQKTEGEKPKTVKGEVLAVGEGRMLETGQLAPIPVKVGETVWFHRYAITEIRIDDIEYKVVTASDLIAVDRE